MINLEILADDIVKVQVTGKLDKDDFQQISKQLDPLLKSRGSAKLLVDATAFNGWSSREAAAKHFTFVRDHHKKIERVAVMAGHEWQHWIAAMAGIFVHPEIKVFDRGEVHMAEDWLRRKLAA